MKHLKSMLLLMLSIVVVFALLVCTQVFGAVELKYMKWARPAEFAVLRPMIEEWNKANPGIKVTLIETGWGKHHQQLDIRLAGGSPPDLFQTTPQYIRKYIAQGHVLDLLGGGYIDSSYIGEFLPIAQEWVVVDGGVWGIPFEVGTSSIIYNVDYFKEIGVQAPKVVAEAWTWSQWEDIGKKLQANTKADYGFTGPFGKVAGDPHMLHSFGGSFLTPDLKQPNVGTQAVITGLKMQKRWYDTGLEPISTLFATPDGPHDLFAAGRTGMYDWGVWMLQFLSDRVGGAFEIDVTFMPKGPFGYSGIAGGMIKTISSKTEHPAEAAKFLLWINEEEQTRKIAKIGQLPAKTSIRATMNWDMWNDQMAKASQSALFLMPIVYMEAYHPNYGAMMMAYKEIMAEAMHDQISIETAVERLDEAIRDLI